MCHLEVQVAHAWLANGDLEWRKEKNNKLDFCKSA